MKKFGRLPRVKSLLALPYAAYRTPALPAPPASFSILPRVLANLKEPISPTAIATVFPMDGNDTIGDCTIAGIAHAQTIWRGMAGALAVLPAGYCSDLYFRLTGGADSGLACTTVLDYVHKNALTGDKVLAYVEIDPHNEQHVKEALSLFGHLYIGFQCTDQVLSQFDAGTPWTVGTLTQDGHCVVITGYDDQYYTCLTWGASQLGTPGWWTQCVEEVYAVVPSEAQVNPQKYLPGYNLAQLIADLHDVEH